MCEIANTFIKQALHKLDAFAEGTSAALRHGLLANSVLRWDNLELRIRPINYHINELGDHDGAMIGLFTFSPWQHWNQ